MSSRQTGSRGIGPKPDLRYGGLRAYAARAGLEVAQDYCDVGVSGRREGRPQLNALMSAARKHEIDCVLVWKLRHLSLVK